MLAETRAFNAQLEQLLTTVPSVETVPVEQTRRARRAGSSIFPRPEFHPRARDLYIAGRAGEIRLRVIPATKAPVGVYLHFHGGGWTLGAADEVDVALGQLVDATGLTAVSVDYRLAPEHPHPAGPDDCVDAALWLINKGAVELGVPSRFAIGGESAGAHLAALTLLRLRDQHGIRGAFKAANLVYGCFDLSQTPSQRAWRRNLVLSPSSLTWFVENYLPGLDREARRASDISPLYADLSALPPALFTVGTLDPLLDDSVFMEARWRLAGNTATIRIWPEAIHAFNYFPIAVAQAANKTQYAFLASALT